MNEKELHKAVAAMGILSNVQRVHHFNATRKLKDGGDELITIEIHDVGQDCEWGRYSVVARNEDGREASGNSFNEIDTALGCVHWYQLDAE